MPIVILILVLIVFILLGGAGLIFGLIYGLFVLAWTALPWLAGMAAIMFLIGIAKGTAREGHSKPRGADPFEQPVQDKAVADMLAHGKAEYEKTFGAIDKPDPWLEAARKNKRHRRRR